MAPLLARTNGLLLRWSELLRTSSKSKYRARTSWLQHASLVSLHWNRTGNIPMICVEHVLPFYTLANTLPWLHWSSMLPIQLLLHEITAILSNITALGLMLFTPRSVSYCRIITHHKVYIHECYVNTQSSITSKYCIKSQIYIIDRTCK